MRERDGDWVKLRGLSFPCLLGVFDWEQSRTQTVELEVEMNFDLDAAASGELHKSVDYARTLDQVQFIAQQGRWRLLESMAAAMARHVLLRPAPGEGRAQVEAAVIRIRKPEVFAGRAVPEVEIRRTAAWAASSTPTRELGGVRVFVLQETAESGAYHVQLAPREVWRVPHGTALRVLAGEVGLADSAESSDQAASAGSALPLDTSALAPRSESCTLLAVSRPPAFCVLARASS